MSKKQFIIGVVTVSLLVLGAILFMNREKPRDFSKSLPSATINATPYELK